MSFFLKKKRANCKHSNIFLVDKGGGGEGKAWKCYFRVSSDIRAEKIFRQHAAKLFFSLFYFIFLPFYSVSAHNNKSYALLFANIVEL